MRFQDHFSTQAGAYAQFRPRYPRELFAWLASIAADTRLAWDVGTGNGQAACALAEYFESVIASEPSAEQLAHAMAHPRVRYCMGPAEAPPPEAQGASLAVAAQALHWFDHARFYPALRRTLAPSGVFAAWCYGHVTVNPAVDAVVQHYYSDIVGPYWPPDRRHIESGYATLPFPLPEIAAPAFVMSAEWTLEALLGYLDTWSATRRYLAAHGTHPLEPLRAAFTQAWGDTPARTIRWPLTLRVGRNL